MTTKTGGELILPEEYTYGLVQGREDEFSISELTGFQSQMIGGILKTGNIIPFPVEESKRLQAVKRERLGYFDANRNSSIPLRNIGTEEEIETILSNIARLQAQSSVFERYTKQDYEPRELRLDEQLFRRLGIQAYKNQLLGIIDGTITASIPPEIITEITRNKLKALGCTEKYLDDFIRKNV